MNLRRTFSLISAIVVILSLLPGVGLAQTKSPEVSAKIEGALLDLFSVKGTADFVVVMAEQADLSAAYDIKDWNARGQYVYDALTSLAERSQAGLKKLLDGRGLRHQTFFTGNELYVWSGDLAAASVLAESPAVAAIRATRVYHIDPVTTGQAELTPDSPTATMDWGIIDTKANLFWAEFGMKGEGLLVANIDTGVQWDHPALVDSFKCGSDPTNPDCWEDPSNICGAGGACDNNGHGTHTMGTMVANDDDALTYIAGMAPNAQWIACKGCESSSCSDTALNACADWIVAPGGDPANRPHVVNNSWGGGGGDTWYQGKVQAWQAAGIFPAFSAGNSTGCSSLGSPGDYQESFGTTGHNSSRVHVYAQGPSATFGHDPYTKPNISAPASSVCSTVPGNSWSCGYSGTSMASPHTAGAVALLWSCNPSLVGDLAGTFEALQNTADAPDPASPACGVPPDGEGTYEDGYGYLNVLAAGTQYCASDFGAVEGNVYNAVTSSPIDGVTVTAYRDSGGSWADQTDPTGYYSLTLGVGTYDVEATHPQYQTGVAADLEIMTDTVLTQNFFLQPRGHLYGYVTDDDSGAPLAATVTVVGFGSTTTNPATGYYEIYVDAGTYDVTAEATDYAAQTVNLSIAAGQELQQDFELLAAVAVTPDPIHATVQLGQIGTLPAQLINNMDVPYPFVFVEKEGDNAVLAGEDVLVVRHDTTAATAMETALTALGFSFLGVTDAQFQAMSVADLLAYQAVFHAGVPGTASTPGPSELLMMAYLDAGGALYISDNDLGYYRNSGTFYQVYLQSTYHVDNGGEILTGEDMMAGMTLDITSDPYPDDFTVGAEGTRIFKFSTSDYAGGVFVDRAGYKAIYTAFDFNQIASAADEIELVRRIMDELGGGDVPWYGTSLTAGTVPANSTLGWTNTFSATVAAGILQPGEYHATLQIRPDNAPTLPRKEIAVIMTVLPTATMGEIAGVVTSDRPGGPLEANVLIESSGGMTWTLPTDPATGAYGYWLEAGTYDVTASAPGYVDETVQVVIVALGSAVQNFELALFAPEVGVSPLSMQETLTFGDTANQTLVITNDGIANLNVELQEVDMGGPFSLRVTKTAAPAVPAAADNEPVSFLPDPNAPSAAPTSGGGMPLLNPGQPAYGISLSNDTLYNWPDIDVPGTWNLIGATAVGSAYCGDFAGNDFGQLYVIDNDNQTLYSVDTATGVKTTIGPSPSLAGQTWTGMAWDPVTRVMYGSATDGTTATLFTINLSTGATTQVATIANAGFTIAIAVSNSGQMYGHDIGTGSIITIDKYTGATAVVGLTGLACNYAQGMDFDPVSGILYLAAYTSVGQIATVDLATGAATVIGGIPGGVETDSFAIQGAGGGDVPWLTETPTTTVVLPGQSVNIDVEFDSAQVPEPGEYYAQLVVLHDDPLADPIAVQVTMTVQPSTDLGRLEGFVTSDRPGGPLQAEVLIDDGAGGTWLVPTDGDGFYYRWLNAGTYDVTASAPNYQPESVQLQITGQMTTTQDFELQVLEPDVVVTPAALQKTLTVGETGTELLNIANDGLAALDYEIFEVPGDGPQSVLGLGGPDPFGYTYKDNAEPDGPMYQWVDISATGTPLVLADDNFGGPFPIGFTFDFYGTDQTQFYIASNGYLAFGAGSSALTNQCPLPSATTPNNLIALMWDDLDPGDTSDPVYYQTFAACPYGVGSCLVVQYEDFCHYPGGATCAIAGTFEAILFENGNVLLQYEDAGAETGSGSTTGIEDSGGTIGLGYGACDTAGSVADGLAVCYNYPGAPPCFGADVPWLSASPISGTLPVDGDQDVTVTFDASALVEPGDYTAQLFVVTNDPFQPTVPVPVVLTVIPSGNVGKVEGTVTGLGYCDQESYPLEADLAFEAADGTTFNTTADPTGYYVQWLLEGTYTVTASAPEHVAEAVVVGVTAGVTTTQDFDLRFIESCMTVAPTSFSMTLPVDTVYTDTLSLGNAGAGELNWELHETTATLLYVGEDVVVHVPAIEAQPGAARSAGKASAAVDVSVHVGWVSTQPVNVLIVTPDIAGAGDISLILSTLAAFPDLVVTVWDGLAGTPTVADMQAYDVVFVGNDILWTSSSIDKTTLSNTLADYIDAGGKVLAGSFVWSYDDWGLAGGRFLTDDYSPFEMATTDIWAPTSLGTFDPSHPIMAGITNVTDNVNHQDVTLSPNGTLVASWADGQPFVAVSPNCVGLNQLYFHTADYGGQVGELLHNALLYLGEGDIWGDVPWVSEDPVSGIVPPGGSTDVDVVFDTNGLTVGECYTASLGLVHDDPGWDTPFMIPLTMCVAEPCQSVTGVELTLASTGPINPGDLFDVVVNLTPLDAAPPFNYSVDGGPAQIATTNPFTITMSIATPGSHLVQVGVWNCYMTEPVMGEMSVVVEDMFFIYLPIVAKQN